MTANLSIKGWEPILRQVESVELRRTKDHNGAETRLFEVALCYRRSRADVISGLLEYVNVRGVGSSALAAMVDAIECVREEDRKERTKTAEVSDD